MSHPEQPATPEKKRVPVYKLGEMIRPFGPVLNGRELQREFAETASSEIAIVVDEELDPFNFIIYARKQQTGYGDGRKIWVVADTDQVEALGDFEPDSSNVSGTHEVFRFREDNNRLFSYLSVQVPLQKDTALMLAEKKGMKNGQIIYENFKYKENSEIIYPVPLVIAPMDDALLSQLRLSFALLDGFKQNSIPSVIVRAFEPKLFHQVRAHLDGI
ncbi:MAG: hypothetical protein RLZZ455_71 [Candidatus Parcubacteria bacterium]|jgi:hypothetical protein